MKKPTNIINKALSFIAIAFLTTAANNAQAVNFLWNNTGTNWTSPASWTNGVQPIATTATGTDVVQFGSVGSGNNRVELTSTRTAQKLEFFSGANAYTFTSASAKLLEIASGGITNASSAVQTFDLRVNNSGGSYTWFNAAGGGLTFNQQVGLTTDSSGTSRTLTLAGDGAYVFNGNLVNNGTSVAPTAKVIYTGNGSIIFNGTNTIGGTTGGGMDITGGGTVTVNGATGAGQGLVTLGGASGTTNMPILRINTTNGLSNLNSLKGSTSLSTMGTLDLLGDNSNSITTYVMNQYQGNNINFTNHGGYKTLLQFTNAANILTSSAASGGGRRMFNNSTNLIVRFDGTLDVGGTASDTSVIGGAGDFMLNGSLLNTGVGVRGLRKDGTGTVTLQAANTYNGDTTITGGTLIVNGSLQSPLTTVSAGATLGGSGLLQGVLLNGGTIAAGNSPGLLSMTSLNGSNGTFAFELGAPTTRGVTYDAMDVSGLLTLGSNTTWTFSVHNNYAFQLNDTYDLMDWGALDASTFDSNTLQAALPDLDTANTGLTWDINSFTTNGTIGVIPEPSAASLMVLGGAVLSLLIKNLWKNQQT